MQSQSPSLIQVNGHDNDPSPDFVNDYCDDHYCCQHPVLSTNNPFLQIILYYDELELCNPLGSKRKNLVSCSNLVSCYKCVMCYWEKNIVCIMYVLSSFLLGAFYYMLGNIGPRLRSRVSRIQLLALAKYTTVVEFGIDKILQPVVQDIHKCESVSVGYYYNYYHFVCTYILFYLFIL